MTRSSKPRDLSVVGSVSTVNKITYVAFAILLNLNLSIGQLAAWQRLAATKAEERFRGFIALLKCLKVGRERSR